MTSDAKPGRKPTGWGSERHRLHKGRGRGYSWEPFQPGNTASLQHGAKSARTFGPIADQLAARLLEVQPDLAGPESAATVRAWSQVEAKAGLVNAYLDEVGLLDEAGAPRPANRLAHDFENKAQRLRRQLGLTPLAAAELSIARAEAAAAARREKLMNQTDTTPALPSGDGITADLEPILEQFIRDSVREATVAGNGADARARVEAAQAAYRLLTDLRSGDPNPKGFDEWWERIVPPGDDE